MARDSQRSKVYQAEGTLPEMWVTPFRTWHDMLQHLEQVCQSRYLRTHYPHVPTYLEVRYVRGRTATAVREAGGRLYLRMVHHRQVSPMLLLHELAHLCAAPKVKHGPAWVTIYLQLVRRFLGADVARRLKQAFLEAGVKTKVGAKRELTLTERSQLMARMAALRQRKQRLAKQRRIEAALNSLAQHLVA